MEHARRRRFATRVVSEMNPCGNAPPFPSPVLVLLGSFALLARPVKVIALSEVVERSKETGRHRAAEKERRTYEEAASKACDDWEGTEPTPIVIHDPEHLISFRGCGMRNVGFVVRPSKRASRACEGSLHRRVRDMVFPASGFCSEGGDI